MKNFLVYTVNHFNLPFTGDKLNRNDYFSWTCFIHTRFDITQIRQRLIPDKIYWRWIGFSKSCTYFLNANKNWFTVISLIAFNYSLIISSQENVILSLKLLLLLHSLFFYQIKNGQLRTGYANLGLFFKTIKYNMFSKHQ